MDTNWNKRLWFHFDFIQWTYFPIYKFRRKWIKCSQFTSWLECGMQAESVPRSQWGSFYSCPLSSDGSVCCWSPQGPWVLSLGRVVLASHEPGAESDRTLGRRLGTRTSRYRGRAISSCIWRGEDPAPWLSPDWFFWYRGRRVFLHQEFPWLENVSCNP